MDRERWPGICEPDDGCGISVDQFVRLQRGRASSQPATPQVEGSRISGADIVAILAAILPLLAKSSSGDPLDPAR